MCRLLLLLPVVTGSGDRFVWTLLSLVPDKDGKDQDVMRTSAEGLPGDCRE